MNRQAALELECWSEEFVSLSSQQASEITQSALVDLQPAGDLWRIVADSRIGVATGSDWEVRVHPRMAIPQLFFLLAYASDPKGWRDQMARFHHEDTLLDSIASGFAFNALRVLERGIMRGYVTTEDRLTTIRGRIRFGDQISRSVTLPLPVEVTFDDFTEDVIENQMIVTASKALLRLPRIPLLARKRLQKICGLLNDVSVVARPREATTPPITRLNQRYEPIMRLSELILHACSLQSPRGGFVGAGFVFDMNRVFEDFVTVGLTEATVASGYESRAHWYDWLDVENKLRIIPDISWWRGDVCVSIGDAKFKELQIRGMPNADAYQMLAYCTALNVRRGYLIYAKDSTSHQTEHSVINGVCSILVRTLDVELAPEDLLRQVSSLGVEMLRVENVTRVA